MLPSPPTTFWKGTWSLNNLCIIIGAIEQTFHGSEGWENNNNRSIGQRVNNF